MESMRMMVTDSPCASSPLVLALREGEVYSVSASFVVAEVSSVMLMPSDCIVG